MIENKRNIFHHGIMIFAVMVARSDQAAYTSGMAHRGGYDAAAKKFYEVFGYLTKDERDELYNNGTIPVWMQEVFTEVEQTVFGTTLWDKA